MSTRDVKHPTILDDVGETADVLASQIKLVAEAARKLKASRLSERAVIVLINDMEKSLAIRDIKLVLDAAARLDVTYIKKAPAK